jgi:hypothetical protein
MVTPLMGTGRALVIGSLLLSKYFSFAFARGGELGRNGVSSLISVPLLTLLHLISRIKIFLYVLLRAVEFSMDPSLVVEKKTR